MLRMLEIQTNEEAKQNKNHNKLAQHRSVFQNLLGIFTYIGFGAHIHFPAVYIFLNASLY